MKRNRLYANKPRLKFHYQNLFARFTTKQLIKKHNAGLQVIDISCFLFSLQLSRFSFSRIEKLQTEQKTLLKPFENELEENSLAAIG